MEWICYEENYIKEGKLNVCGVDEAGRGPLAGPVCAAAVIMPQGLIIEGVNDSKKLTPKKRDYLYNVICENAIDYKIESVGVEEIDELNILNATLLAMKRCIESLKPIPNVALIDGNVPPKTSVETHTIIKGDAVCHSIACASILAKVSRDRFMMEAAKKYPQYGFEKHKGYGTKLHIEMIKQYGVCPIHRKTFLKKILGNA